MSNDEDRRKLENELAEVNPAFYITLLHVVLKTMFMIYDSLVELPFQIFASPKDKRELSDRVKAKPTVEGDPSSDWRHVDTIGGDLWNNPNDFSSLGDLWDKGVTKYANNRCMGTRELIEGEEKQQKGKTFQQLTLGDYEFHTFEEVDERVKALAFGLKTFELKKGDYVVIFAETRADWMQTALACFKSGYPVITVYATLGEDGVAYALKECDAKVIFTTRNLLPKVAKALEACPSIHTVVYYQEQHRRTDDNGYATESHIETFRKMDKRLESFETLLDIGAASNHAVENPGPDDLAMIMYTSGTTGNPKGVMLSHRNIIAAISGQQAVIPLTEDDVFIGYLPLAHILEVCAEFVVLINGGCIGYSSAQTLFDRAPKIKKGTKGDCAVLKPTLIACVPAVMDRIFKAVTDEVKSTSPIMREIFRLVYERKRSRYEDGYVSLVKNKLAFSRISKLLGGSLRYILSGGAPLNPETQRFMNICFGCPVVQGYGLTETCGGGTLADEFDLSTGSVGPPLRCCEIRLREWKEANYSPKNETPQGEVLISGDNVSLGYFKNEKKTKEDFIELDGKRYFATGDIGEFRSDGSLRIIDRKKDLIKLAHGEYISLGKVETTLLTNPNIDNICVYGDSNRDFLIALVVPNKKNVEKLANENGISGSWEEKCDNKKLGELLVKQLSSSVSGKLNKTEIPKTVIVCHDPWTPANGMLTEALKLKRKEIEKNYEKQIKEAYSK
ncbi:AMP-binding domain-containing protein [Aphelenchoides besseyi]|nr:AMP-binding domain-containing protein [Aphelenchoides besseyi]